MKQLFLALAVMLTLITNAQGQQLIVYNHTGCEWFIRPYMEDQTPPKNVAVGNTYANYISVAPFFYHVSATPWKDVTTSFPAYYAPTWIWSHIDFWPAMCYPLPSGGGPFYTVSGSDRGLFSAASSTYPSSIGMLTCCGDNTITWTDLGNGDIQIDIY